ncbi:MAG: BRCT domain-containing protein [Alphaproteobacteria bacterium]|nr:BRCT domain-containing protein [Alphaproteobacteria bacterium]MCB9794100.1 BRCT domain-containing protein [Alphaproteobacteria bacterium]
MDGSTRLNDVRLALAARDPDLPRLVAQLAQTDVAPDTGPVRAGAFTLTDLKGELSGWRYRRMSPAERQRTRVEGFSKLLAEGAEAPAPDRLRLDAVLLELWAATGAYERGCLLEIIATVPLRWGPWRALKRIFKEAELAGDLEVWGALAARFDMAYADAQRRDEVRQPTLAYLVRRAWRHLRRLGEGLPAAYADAAVQVLRFYREDTNWAKTWIANHVFYHETGKYSRASFKLRPRPSTLLKYRAFGELWRRSPRPLFLLLETARSEQARRFAVDALRSEFRAQLREVEPAWVARLVDVDSVIAHDFVVWVLKNVPRFEQAAFRELGLHEPVLSLLESRSSDAQTYAADYARTHARDLPLETLLRLADSDSAPVQALAKDLLGDRDPRKDVGLEAWGRLLATRNGHELAAEALRKHFGARELTPDWFRERLLSGDSRVFSFASDLLEKLHPAKKLGVPFFQALLEDERVDWRVSRFALGALERLSAEDIPLDFVKRALVMRTTSAWFIQQVDADRIKAVDLGADFLKALAFEPTWDASDFVAGLRSSGNPVLADASFDRGLAGRALGWLGDVRRFSPDQLGFDWLLQMVEQPEDPWNSFAVEYMIKAFVPADFAPASDEAPAAAEASSGEINIDLGGQSFLFTGKLATMTRSEATKKVTAAGGANASGVNAKLDYLVIGDEGSPLYGGGRKGSKQVKAEKLRDDGADIKIISETAFLQMLAGEERSFDEGDILTGAARIWEMAVGGERGDTPLARFAMRYVRRHHPDIGLAMTDRPVDPGAEIPEAFLTFELVRPLLEGDRGELRKFALELCRYEFARWEPPMQALVELCEGDHKDVRDFVVEALTAEESRETRRFRVPPARLTPEAAYRFVESQQADTREVGMMLIRENPRLAVPEELFRLTESPDRAVRAFVLRALWSLYRSRDYTQGWAPSKGPERKLGAKAGATVEGPTPRAEGSPAPPASMRDLLRRVLFTIPPARPPKGPGGGRRLKPLPARKAKLGLIEVMRDLAVEDRAFAELTAPLLAEFMESRGQSERAACMVALARVDRAWPDLAAWPAEED